MMALRNYGLSIFLVLLLHTYIGECSDEKRMLLQDNYYTIESKLNNLTKDMEALKKEMGESSLYFTLQKHRTLNTSFTSLRPL